MPDMLKVEKLKKNFGDLEVLKDISLTVKEGEKLVIIGPSGSGKSTFIQIGRASCRERVYVLV